MTPRPRAAVLAALTVALAALLCPAPASAQAESAPAGSPDPVREGALEESGSPEAAAPAPGAPESPRPGTGPKLVVLDPGPMFQGGVSEPGSSLSHDFVIENAGASPLTIESVVPGCGCTVASYDSFIAPGRTGKVTVTLDLYREWAGQEYLKVVTVISNDPENPRMRLAMKGRVGMGMNPPVSEPGVPPSGPDASPGQPGDLKAPPVPDAPAGPEAPAAPASPAGPSGSPGQGGQS